MKQKIQKIIILSTVMIISVTFLRCQKDEDLLSPEIKNVSLAKEWFKKYEWEQKRLDFHASPTKIKQLLQQELLKIANGDKATLPADSISKLMATLDRLNKQADPIVVHSILKELDLFISRID